MSTPGNRRGWYRHLKRRTERATHPPRRYAGYEMLNITMLDLFTMWPKPWDRHWRVVARRAGFDLRRLSLDDARYFYGS